MTENRNFTLFYISGIFSNVTQVPRLGWTSRFYSTMTMIAFWEHWDPFLAPRIWAYRYIDHGGKNLTATLHDAKEWYPARVAGTNVLLQLSYIGCWSATNENCQLFPNGWLSTRVNKWLARRPKPEVWFVWKALDFHYFGLAWSLKLPYIANTTEIGY